MNGTPDPVIMEIALQGRQTYYYPNSDLPSLRMTYTSVNDILAGDEEKAQTFEKLSQVFINGNLEHSTKAAGFAEEPQFGPAMRLKIWSIKENRSMSSLRQKKKRNCRADDRVLYADCQWSGSGALYAAPKLRFICGSRDPKARKSTEVYRLCF